MMRMSYGTLKSSVFAIIQYGCVTHCVLEHVANILICSGPSMEPTLTSNDVIISERISVKMGKFANGDIVIAKSPKDPEQHVCKRITGLPGDKVSRGVLQAEHVPKGHVWLEGDNHDNSTDSREYGPIPQGLIVGRVICRIWPFNSITALTVK